jgi:ATP-dependent Clp protease ATP-binding subunit ClpX
MITPLMPLTRAAMIQILVEPKNALLKQYQHLFSLEGAKLEFTDDALALLAERALERDTGARALRGVLDEFMIDIMYHLPDVETQGVTFIVDGRAIEESLPITKLHQHRAKESA